MGVCDYGCIIYGTDQVLSRFHEIASEDELSEDEDCGEELSGSVDEYNPILEIYVFPENLDVDSKNLTDHIRSKKYEAMVIDKTFEYSWDDWDFVPSLGQSYTNAGCEAVWKISLLEDEDNSLDREKLRYMFPYVDFSVNHKIWVRNISTDAYNRYIACKTYNPDITMSELRHVYEVLEIPNDNLSKPDKYKKILDEIMHKYNL